MRVRLWRPIQDVETAQGKDWRCPVEIHGLKAGPIQFNGYGVDSIQALQVALQGVRAKLAASGERVLWFPTAPQLGAGFERMVPEELREQVERVIERWAANRAALPMRGRTRHLAAELTNECSVVDNLPGAKRRIRRFEQILRVALRHRLWGPAIVAGALAEAQYLDLGVRGRKEELHRLLERIHPLFLKDKERKKRRRQNEPGAAVPWPAQSGSRTFTLPPSRDRARIDTKLRHSMLIEPAAARVWELDRIRALATERQCDWEAYLAALFKLSALSLVPGGPRRQSTAWREAMRLGRAREVQAMLASDGHAIFATLRRWRGLPPNRRSD